MTESFPEKAPAFMLHAFRETKDGMQLVGTLTTTPEDASFSYDNEYLTGNNAEEISLSLPLRSEPFHEDKALAFFEGLLPEGTMRGNFARAIHIDESFYAGLLAKLNNESIGGLVFNTQKNLPSEEASYVPLPFETICEFANRPIETALTLGSTSRLSLSGAQTKVGLYHHRDEDAWFKPIGSAPSNTIVKAASGLFPHQTVNEAFCLAVAGYCNFDVTPFRLIRISGSDPLIAVKRFDRVIPSDGATLHNLAVPTRLHQEDFCQAAGLLSHFKYEPTDGRYLELGAHIISRTSTNPFGDKMMFFNRILFDYLIGNCDNHLKNSSMLWGEDWATRTLSPLYDITCTTMYPSLAREMGISLCESRRIDDVTASDIRKAARRIGISERLGWEQYLSLREEFQAALPLAEQMLAEQGFPEIRSLAEFITQDAIPRCSL